MSKYKNDVWQSEEFGTRYQVNKCLELDDSLLTGVYEALNRFQQKESKKSTNFVMNGKNKFV